MSDSDKALDPSSSSGGDPILPMTDRDHNDLEEISEDIRQDVAHLNLDDDEDDDDDFIQTLPAPIQMRLIQLKELDKERDLIMEDYLKERAVLEKKFSDLCKPMYEKRRAIINDEKPDTDRDTEEEEEEEEEEDSSEDIKGIPDFWSVAMCNIEVIEELITERDHECLTFLEDICCEDNANGDGFKLSFFFKQNPFFTNRVLSKIYDVPNLLLADEPILKRVNGCKIDWKEGMCLTHQTISKKQRNKKGQIRNIKKQEHVDSFFHFFTPPQLPATLDIDEEEADAIEEAFDHDYDVAQAFRSHIIPKAVLWFTGEAMQSELDGVNDDIDTFAHGDNRSNAAPDLNANAFSASVPGSGEPECKQQ
jgi:nucleosome assembly protein 1-like 1